MPASDELGGGFGAEDCEAGPADASDDALGAEYAGLLAEIRAFRAEFAAVRAASDASWAEIEHRLSIFWWGLAALIIGATVAMIAAVAIFSGA